MPPLFVRGDVIDGRFVVDRKLGEGQFAEVYSVEDRESAGSTVRALPPSSCAPAAPRPRSRRRPAPAAPVQYALKVEKKQDSRMGSEHRTLKELQGCRQICSVHGHGRHDQRAYLVMDLLGPNLAEARRDAGGRLEPSSAKLVGAGLLAAIQSLHQEGYVHRDIKPANFAVEPPEASLLEGAPPAAAAGLGTGTGGATQ